METLVLCFASLSFGSGRQSATLVKSPIETALYQCGDSWLLHSLVASGTSSKQVKSEPDALFVGYGSMLTEGALATLVIAAVAGGIGLGYKAADGSTLFGVQAWSTHYASWTAAAGLGSKIAAFVTGAANFLTSLGIPQQIAIVIMGVFVASFAGTTLDTATRIQRYIISELSLIHI